MSEASAAATLTCPGCLAPMTRRRFAAHYGRSVDVDLCHGCGLIWFDAWESTALTPGAVLKLFAVLDEHRDQRHPLAVGVMYCPRCGQPLELAHDRQRATPFAYWRCPRDEGRRTTFFDFLREKNFVRPLSPERLAELRRYAPTVNCSACGAPVDLAHESACAHCRAPLSMLDPDQVQAAMRDLQGAEEHRTSIDPTLPVRLLADRAALERAFRAAPAQLSSGDLGGAFGIVEAGISAIVRLLSGPSGLSAR